MKRFLSLFFILCLCVPYTLAQENENVAETTVAEEMAAEESGAGIPVWTEFCPKKYLNAAVATPEEYKSRHKFLFGKYLQSNVDKHNQNVNYWQGREEKFEYFLEVCSNFPLDKQEACYQRLRDREVRLTKEFDAQGQVAAVDDAAKRKLQQDSKMMMGNDGMQMMNNVFQNIQHTKE